MTRQGFSPLRLLTFTERAAHHPDPAGLALALHLLNYSPLRPPPLPPRLTPPLRAPLTNLQRLTHPPTQPSPYTPPLLSVLQQRRRASVPRAPFPLSAPPVSPSAARTTQPRTPRTSAPLPPSAALARLRLSPLKLFQASSSRDPSRAMRRSAPKEMSLAAYWGGAVRHLRGR